MLETCLDCVRKHLSKAMCYLSESKLAYPARIWRCVGEICLAEDEAAEKYHSLALTIRRERMRYLEFACDSRHARLVPDAPDAEHQVVYDVFPEDGCEIQALIDQITAICIVERQAKEAAGEIARGARL